MHKTRKDKSMSHADGATTRPEVPELEGRMPLPEEITGKASATDEDLVKLFEDKGSDHFADGFRGAGEDETAQG